MILPYGLKGQIFEMFGGHIFGMFECDQPWHLIAQIDTCLLLYDIIIGLCYMEDLLVKIDLSCYCLRTSNGK